MSDLLNIPVHSWNFVEFSYGSWIECLCGFRPSSQRDMDIHIPYKITIRKAKHKNKPRFRNHWWVRCPLCGTKTHVHQNKWQQAIDIADRHVVGKPHQNKLKQFIKSQQGEKR